MTKREKQGAIIAGLSLLAIGAGFAFFPKKKCAPGETIDEETGECIPWVIDPSLCPPGQIRNEAGECIPVVIVDPPEPSDDVPGDIDDIIKPFPEGGNFYQVKAGDWPGSGAHGANIKANYNLGLPVSGWLIRREMFHAAQEYGGLSNEAAMVWVNNMLKGGDLLNPSTRTLDIILCSAFNDACYGTWGYCGQKAIDSKKCPASMRNRAGPTGRGIRLLKAHPNNIKRIRDGLAVARYATIGNPANAGDGSSKNTSGKTGHYPALWMPKLDRQRLWESANANPGFASSYEIEASSEIWDDGSPMSSPPPWVMKDGQILDYSGSLKLPGAYGCDGGRYVIEFVPGG